MNFSEHPEKKPVEPPTLFPKSGSLHKTHPVPVALASLPLPMGCPDPDLEEGETPVQLLTCPASSPSLASVSSLVEWRYEYLLGKMVLRIKGEDSHRLGAITPAGRALGNLLGHSQLMLLFFQGKSPLACTAWIWAERFFLTRPSGLQQNSMCLLLKCNR